MMVQDLDKQPSIVLLVDDDDANRYFVSRILRQANYEVMEAATGTTAIELAEQNPDLIILDIKLPDIDGFKVCQTIKSNSSTSTIPILHLSALYVSADDKVYGLDSGADGYLVHPVNPRELIANVKALLRIRQVEKQLQHRERQLSTLVDNLPDIIFRLDRNLRYSYISPVVECVSGIAPQQFIGKTIRELGLPADLCDRFELQCREAMTAGQMTYREYSLSGNYYSLRLIPESDSLLGIAEDITDRKQAEDRWQLALRGTNDGIWDRDLQSSRLFVSERCLEMTGYERDELDTFDKWLQNVHPEDVDRLLDTWQRHLARKTPFYQCEYRMRQKNGNYRWFLSRCKGLWDDRGNAIRAVGSISDITDRKLAEEALRASQERFRLIAETVEDVFWILDLSDLQQRRIIYVSPAYERIWGRSCESIYDNYQTWLESVHPEDRAKVVSAATESLAGGDVAIEYRILRPDGSVRWIRDRGFLVRNNDGSPTRIVGIAQDITERKQSELALQESEHRYATLAVLSPVGIFRCDRDGYCIYFNERWSEMSGISLEASLGIGWQQAVHPDDRDRVLIEWHRSVADNVPYRTECRIQRQDGTIVWVLVQALPEIEHNNRIVSYIGTVTDISDRKVAETSLRESEEQRRLALDLTHIGSWDWNFVTNRSVWNENHFRLLGLQPGELPSSYQTWRDRVHPEDVERVERELTLAVVDCEDYEAEYRIVRPDGSVRWLASKGRAIYNEAGKPTRMLGVVFDISDRKIAEEALRVSEERLKSFFEANVIGIIYGDVYGNIQDANDEFLRIVGYTKEDLRSGRLRWVDITPAEYLSLDKERVTEAKERGACTPYEKEYIRADGSRVTVLIGYGLVGEEREESVAFILDLSEQKQAEAAIIQSQETINRQLAEIESIYQTAPIGLAILDANLRFVRINERLAEINGHSVADHIGRTVREMIPDIANQVEPMFQQVLATGEPILDLEIDGETDAQPGVERTWLENWFPIEDSDGNIIGINLGVQEITDRKRAELQLLEQAKKLGELNKALTQATEQLSERNQELDRFVYVVSHDLKAPLRAIANLSTWIEEDLDGHLPEANKEQMTLLRQRVHRMENLIDGLLAYSRVGRTEVATVTVDVGVLLEEVIDSLAPPPTIAIAVQPNMPTIVAKRLLLNQVFANLIGNAIKHRDRPDGKIEISAIEKGDYYEFSVADDGPGIALENQERVFGIFQTLKGRDTQENTGVGLTIVKKIIETEGGRITLESEPGKGATFRFTWLKQGAGDRRQKSGVSSSVVQ